MKILVLGASGMWGHQAYLKLSEHFGSQNVACSLRKSRDDYSSAQFADGAGIFNSGIVFDKVDWLDFEKARHCLDTFKPNWIINCVGLTPRKYDVKDEAQFLAINAHLPQKLAFWAQANGAKLIHFSTDCVFNGKKGSYTELDLPDATDVYGRSKALGEIRASQVLTLRLSKIGREIEKKTEIVEWILSKRGDKAQGYSKAMYSGVTSNFMAKELIRIIEKFPQIEGLYQISGEPISKYELLKLINDVYQAHVDIQPKDDYVLDKTLKCDLYSTLTGYKQPKWSELILQMKQEERVNYDSIK